MDNNITERIIDKLFIDNPNLLVAHQLDSYNDFFKNGIRSIFKEKNPIKIAKMQDPNSNIFMRRCNIYLGGKNGDKLYYGKPVIFDTERDHYMYPNEARLRNMTYGITIHYDVEVEFFIMNDGDDEAPSTPTHVETLEKIFLGRFPIMLKSSLCILNKLSPSSCFELGECRNDHGGYFIIDGKEKCIVSQEKFADNMLYIRDKVNDIYSHSAEIRSVSEDASKPVRTMAVRIVAPSTKLTNNNIVVVLPNVRKAIPLFILMRALGVQSDESIIKYCLLDMKNYESYIDFFIPSIHDAGLIFNQTNALKYIASFTKGKSVTHAHEILTNYLLPHMGEMNYKDKAYFIGHMVREMLKVYMKEQKATDRDSFRYKRVELPGMLLYDLFKEYYSLQQKNIFQKIDKEYYYKQGLYQDDFLMLIKSNAQEFFSERIVETGFKKAFKGNWGAEAHTKKVGVVQDLNRLSYNAAISHLRKINLPFDASAKIIGPRLLHSSQWGIIDPVDTPDGGNVGLHKHMSLAAKITSGCSSKPFIQFIRNTGNMKLLTEVSSEYIGNSTKLFINGNWIGVVSEPENIIKFLLEYRRNALIPIYTSIYWSISEKVIYIYTDGGRICRPVFYIKDGRTSIQNDAIIEKIKSNNFTWNNLVSGFANKKDKNFNIDKCKIYSNIKDLYDVSSIEDLYGSEAVIEYMDTAEAEAALIAVESKDLNKKLYTHVEIHASLLLGVMGNQVVFPENNQLPRDLFACGQMKQAVSLYHSNFPVRIDKTGVVLNYGQVPLIKSRYLKKISNEEHPYGENVIVAIMSYNGYNVEDSILFNEGSIQRGLFRTTYYNSYEAYEESSKVANSQVDTRFTNIEDENVTRLKPGYDYSLLDKSGLVEIDTYLNEKTVLIGKVMTNLENPDTSIDASIFPKKGQIGYVDKTFITEGETGFRLAKVRIRNERLPAIGDKFCSRCGQKGTIGLVIPEKDMPFGDDGIKPDIIINPHAIPSRMTIGQLVETLTGKTCSIYGGFGDCTAFMNKGQKSNFFGNMLTDYGYNSTGNQLLYCGQTGEQIAADIFIGPTYYMRLKHMVKDKINYRARGPRTALTRQTVQGRANDGGLRIGEMERDVIISHGATKFLQDSLLNRGDEYYMAVCNKTGMIAIYNYNANIFLSPYADGPIKFTGNLEDNLNIVNISKYGRSFSVVKVPYALKLLIQELQTMNVQMRIITEDNIDKLSSMSFSKNIENLLGNEISANKVIENAKSMIKTDKKDSELSTLLRNSSKKTSKQPSVYSKVEPPQNISVNTKTKIYPSLLAWYKKEGDLDGDTWESIIIDQNGNPTSRWYTGDHNGDAPNEFAPGWISSELYYPNGNNISTTLVINELRKDQSPSNWQRVIKNIKEKNILESPANNELAPIQQPNLVDVTSTAIKQELSPEIEKEEQKPYVDNLADIPSYSPSPLPYKLSSDDEIYLEKLKQDSEVESIFDIIEDAKEDNTVELPNLEIKTNSNGDITKISQEVIPNKTNDTPLLKTVKNDDDDDDDDKEGNNIKNITPQ